MNRTRWLVLLGILLLLAACCGLALCGASAWFYAHLAHSLSDTNQVLPEESTPALPPVQRPPTPAEEETARRVANSTPPTRDLWDLARRLEGLSASAGETRPITPPDYRPGDTEVFWLHNQLTNDYFTATAVLRYETPHARWWIEEGYQVPDEKLKRSARRFEEQTYPTNRRIFGSEPMPGIDGDPHVYLFLGNVPGVGGYFSGPDEYPTLIRPHSNQHEMFYINLENALPGNDYFDGILAHEFQHMIHWWMDRDEETWVNEGLSELAAHLNGYDVGGSDLDFLLAPDTQLTTWPELEDSAPHYGASYLFLTYFLEQTGEEAVRRLVAEPANGIAGFEAVLAREDRAGRQFEELFADWVVANYLDDPDLAGGRYGYTTLHLEPPLLAAQHITYPVQSRATVHQYATDYILLEGEGEITIEFTGTRLVPLVGNETRSGTWQWWAVRGDEGDATLTRPFDLSTLDRATLQAWMWYDLETDYDYAYVEVSTDGGQTWTLLANSHTTFTNPSGNSYGPGFTGKSGSGQEAEWVQESFDLTPYTGQPVLLRFEVVTDEAVTHPGLCLDGVSIPELGYADDAEEGDGGWQASGWLRVTDQIPQKFLVQLITLGQDKRVTRMALDERNHGLLTVAGLDDRALLVVSALTPTTTQPATYAYRVTQE